MSSEDETEEVYNDFDKHHDSDGSMSSVSDDDTNGPKSMFSFLKPLHVPGETSKRDAGATSASSASQESKVRNVPPPVAPKPQKAECEENPSVIVSQTGNTQQASEETRPELPLAARDNMESSVEMGGNIVHEQNDQSKLDSPELVKRKPPPIAPRPSKNKQVLQGSLPAVEEDNNTSMTSYVFLETINQESNDGKVENNDVKDIDSNTSPNEESFTDCVEKDETPVKREHTSSPAEDSSDDELYQDSVDMQNDGIGTTDTGNTPDEHLPKTNNDTMTVKENITQFEKADEKQQGDCRRIAEDIEKVTSEKRDLELSANADLKEDLVQKNKSQGDNVAEPLDTPESNLSESFIVIGQGSVREPNKPISSSIPELLSRDSQQTMDIDSLTRDGSHSGTSMEYSILDIDTSNEQQDALTDQLKKNDESNTKDGTMPEVDVTMSASPGEDDNKNEDYNKIDQNIKGALSVKAKIEMFQAHGNDQSGQQKDESGQVEMQSANESERKSDSESLTDIIQNETQDSQISFLPEDKEDNAGKTLSPVIDTEKCGDRGSLAITSADQDQEKDIIQNTESDDTHAETDETSSNVTESYVLPNESSSMMIIGEGSVREPYKSISSSIQDGDLENQSSMSLMKDGDEILESTAATTSDFGNNDTITDPEMDNKSSMSASKSDIEMEESMSEQFEKLNSSSLDSDEENCTNDEHKNLATFEDNDNSTNRPKETESNSNQNEMNISVKDRIQMFQESEKADDSRSREEKRQSLSSMGRLENEKPGEEIDSVQNENHCSQASKVHMYREEEAKAGQTKPSNTVIDTASRVTEQLDTTAVGKSKTEKSFGISRPPPPPPKSETVLESMKAQQSEYSSQAQPVLPPRNQPQWGQGYQSGFPMPGNTYETMQGQPFGYAPYQQQQQPYYYQYPSYYIDEYGNYQYMYPTMGQNPYPYYPGTAQPESYTTQQTPGPVPSATSEHTDTHRKHVSKDDEPDTGKLVSPEGKQKAAKPVDKKEPPKAAKRSIQPTNQTHKDKPGNVNKTPPAHSEARPRGRRGRQFCKDTDTHSLNVTAPIKLLSPPDQPKKDKKRHRSLSARKAKSESREPGEWYIYVKNVKPGSQENLVHYIEAGSDASVVAEKLIYNDSKLSALLVLDSKPDVDKLRDRVQEKTLEGNYLSVFEVGPPHAIAVSSESDLNVYSLELYFEAPRNGGGEIDGEAIEVEDRSCIIITFKDPKVVQSVCSKVGHCFEQKTLRVSPCYQCESESIWDTRLHPLPVAEPVHIPLERTYATFLKRFCQDKLEAHIQNKDCGMSLEEEGITLTCTLTPGEGNYRQQLKAWPAATKQLIDEFVEANIVQKTLSIQDHVWDELKNFIQSECQASKMVLKFNDESRTIIFTGFPNLIDEDLMKIEAKQNKIDRKFQKRSKSKEFSSLALSLPSVQEEITNVQDNIEDAEVHVTATGVSVNAVPDDIDEIYVKVYEVMAKVKDKHYPHSYSKECVQLVERDIDTIKPAINKVITNKGVEASWVLNKDELIVYVYKGDLEDVRQVVIDFIEEQDLDLDEEEIRVLEGGKGTEFQNNLIECYDKEAAFDVRITQRKRCMHVYGLEGTVKEIIKQTKEFLDENCIRQKTISCPLMSLTFLKMHGETAITNLEREHSVTVRLEDTVIRISANKESMKAVEREIQRLLDKVVHEDHTIQKMAVVEVFKDSQIIEEVERDTKCVIHLKGEYEKLKKVSQAARAVPEDLPMMDDDSVDDSRVGSNVRIVKGEIARQKADVIVAATSPTLKLASGAASRNMSEVGGEILQQECDQRYPNGIQQGEIAVINGGNIKCSKIYLTTLTTWSPTGSSEKTLYKVITDSLKMGSSHNKKSIAFAAMGTGQLKYPPDVVARVMFQAVRDFQSKAAGSSLTDVQFVLHPKDRTTIAAFEDEEHNQQRGGRPRHSYGTYQPARPPQPALSCGSLTIELVVESLEKQQVDCVLAATNPSMELSKSGACKSLAAAAGGTTLQDECKNKHGNQLQVKKIVEIGAGKLPFKSVFLTVLPEHKEEETEPNLTETITTFLNHVQAKKYTSIAIPALGTGYLKYPKDLVSRTMYMAVSRWANNNPKTCVKKVRFVMFRKDFDTIQTFKGHHTRMLRGGSKQRNFTLKPGGKKKPDHGIQVTKEGCLIGNVSLKIQTGDILESRTDVIVSSATKHFEFKGAVATTLLKKCPGLKKECDRRKFKFQAQGLASTKSCGLNAGHIIHVQFQESLPSWKKIMGKCLDKANDKKWGTIAFPVLGSGGGPLSFKPEGIAECLFEAIEYFTKKHQSKNHVKEVRLVVFHKQPEMVEPIKKAIQKKAAKAPASTAERISGFFSDTFQGFKDFCLGAETKGLMTGEERKAAKQKLSAMPMTIYSDDREHIKKCKTILDEKVEKEYKTKKIDTFQDLVKSLQKEEKRLLLDTNVFADINLDENSGIITVKGTVWYVATAVGELQEKLRNIEKDRSEKHEADLLYKQVMWHFEEITTTEAKLVAYDPIPNYKIEMAFKKNEDNVELHDNDGTVYVVDFGDLEEYVKGDRNDKMKVVRKDVLKSGGAELPANWDHMDDGETVKIVSLLNTNPEFKAIETEFLKQVKTGKETQKIQYDLNKLKVTKVERIQNKSLWQQYVAKKKQMTLEKTKLPANMPIERSLWHGTTQQAASSIKSHGFNRSYCGVNGVWYGQGVYFAGDASYSAKGWLSGSDQIPSGQVVNGWVFQVKALTGQYCAGNRNMRYLSAVDQQNPKVLYDSAVDNVANPFEFVIFTDTQSYPEYLIEYTSVKK